jgi:hypothetical protein
MERAAKMSLPPRRRSPNAGQRSPLETTSQARVSLQQARQSQDDDSLGEAGMLWLMADRYFLATNEANPSLRDPLEPGPATGDFESGRAPAPAQPTRTSALDRHETQVQAQAALTAQLNRWHVLAAAFHDSIVTGTGTGITFGIGVAVPREAVAAAIKEVLKDWLRDPQTPRAVATSALAQYGPGVAIGALAGAAASILAQVVLQPLASKAFSCIAGTYAFVPAAPTNVVPDANPDRPPDTDVAAERKRIAERQSHPLGWASTMAVGSVSFAGAHSGRAAAAAVNPPSLGIGAASNFAASGGAGAITGLGVGLTKALMHEGVPIGRSTCNVHLYTVTQGSRPGLEEFRASVVAAARDFAGGRRGFNELSRHVMNQYALRATGILTATMPLIGVLPATAAFDSARAGPAHDLQRQALAGGLVALSFVWAVLVWFPWLKAALARQAAPAAVSE